MGDEPTIGETRAERIKRKWDEGEPERAARRAEREAAARQPERETVGLLRQRGHSLAGPGWRLLLTLITLAALALPAVVVGSFVDSAAGAKVGGATLGIVVVAAVVLMSAGTKYSGDY